MRQLVVFLAALILGIAGFFFISPDRAAWAASTEVSLRLDGRPLSGKGYVDGNGRTLVPVRVVAEELGYDVNWEAAARRVTVTSGSTQIQLWVGQRRAIVSGREVALDCAPAIRGGRTLVPLRFIGESLGLVVRWEAASRTVYLSRAPQTRLTWLEVKERVVNVRSGPGTNYPRIAQVTLGTRLPTLEIQGEWWKVVLPSGASGWIAGWLVAESQPPGPDTSWSRVAVVTADGVRLRAGPSTEFPILGRVNQGEQLPVLTQYGSWYQVSRGDQKAWIAGWLVAVRVSSSASRSEEPGEERPPASGEAESPLPQEQGEPTTVQGLSWSLEETTQLVVSLKLSGRPVWYPGRLLNPDRLYLDLAPAVLTGELIGRQEELPEGPVARLRVGQFQATTVRLVFDLRDKGVTWRVVNFDPDAGELTLAVGPVDLAGRLVVLDPGHGSQQSWGSDPGAVGPTGLKERDVVLAVALEAKRLLEERGGRVMLTRTGEVTSLSLYDRAALANQQGAQVFVSIHANSSPSPDLDGTCTYYCVPAHLEYQREARRSLAFSLQQALVSRLGRPDKGVRQANFAVLRATEMPSALVELAFISNPNEERLLADPAFQRLAAQALVEGIVDFLAWH
ncbi:MAG: N-acetylmuramoyl-L-alanine amidase [Moorellales bacterium]